MPKPHLLALAEAEPVPFWLEALDADETENTLVEDESADLCVVGGGYTGLWTAILAKERDPATDVVLVEGKSCGHAASGRNGGFFESSLTHGSFHGLARFPDELAMLEELGLDNLREIESFISRHSIECGWQRNGVIDVATDPELVPELAQGYEELKALGQDVEYMDGETVRAMVHSPTYLAGLYRKDRAAICDPARLANGLKKAALELGVRIYEDSLATSIESVGDRVEIKAGYGTVTASRMALGTNAFPPLLKAIRHRIAPVYDYCLATEPLTDKQMELIGWEGRQGLGDTANQFHYYRLTEDNRIIWGGYDALYYFGNKTDQVLEQRPETFAILSEHFFETFPQLEGLLFTNAWGGVIDTSTRFSVFWGTAYEDKVAYAVGYTGLGAAASRFGASVMLDLLYGVDSPTTRSDFVRKRPLPFPPEPLRWTGIQLTRWSLGRADANGGKRNVWLKSLDKVGLGFDS